MIVRSKQHLDAAFLDLVRTLLHYDAETGDLLWSVDLDDGALSGQVATRVQVDPRGYRSTSVDVEGKTYMAPRLIWFLVTGQWPKHQIHHRNGNSLDNRIDNLMDVTRKTAGRVRRLRLAARRNG